MHYNVMVPMSHDQMTRGQAERLIDRTQISKSNEKQTFDKIVSDLLRKLPDGSEGNGEIILRK